MILSVLPKEVAGVPTRAWEPQGVCSEGQSRAACFCPAAASGGCLLGKGEQGEQGLENGQLCSRLAPGPRATLGVTVGEAACSARPLAGPVPDQRVLQDCCSHVVPRGPWRAQSLERRIPGTHLHQIHTPGQYSVLTDC